MDSLIEDLLALDPKLRRIAARIAADPQEADDLVQDVWLAALTKWPGPDCALRPWALQVLRNQAARRSRRPRPRASGLEFENLEDAAAAEQTLAERREAQRHLRACIESLPEPYRGTLIDRFYASRSVRDIAAARGMPRATVSTHLHRALERLRARLGRASDLLGLFLPLRWSRRGTVAAKEPATDGALFVRVLAFACVGPPLVLAVAWARSSDSRALESRLPVSFSPVDALAVADRPSQPSSSRTALPLDPDSREELLRVQVRAADQSQDMAGCKLDVWSEDGTLYVRTADAQGNCTLPADLSRGWLSVSVEPRAGERIRELIPGRASESSNGPADVGSTEHANGRSVEQVNPAQDGAPFRTFARAKAGELHLIYRRGPRLLVRFRSPRGTHPAELVYGLRSPGPGALTSPRLQVGPSSQASVWTVQLPADWSRMTELGEVALHVGTPDGLLAGDALITQAALGLREPAELEFEPRAALSVSIRSASGGPLRNGAIRLQPIGEQAAWIAAPGADGQAWIPGLRAGSYRMETVVPGAASWVRELELAAGVRESVNVDLSALASAGAGGIQGRIVRKREAYDGAVIVVLEGGRCPQFKRLNWTECPEGFEANFAFPEVDAEHPLVRPIALDGMPRFDPPVAEARLGGEAIEFVCHGARSASSTACDVRSHAGGDPIEDLQFEFDLPGGTEISYRRIASAAGEAPRWAVSTHGLRWKVREGAPWDWLDADPAVHWTLSSPGFESLRGEWRAWDSAAFSALLRPKPASAAGDAAPVGVR